MILSTVGFGLVVAGFILADNFFECLGDVDRLGEAQLLPLTLGAKG